MKAEPQLVVALDFPTAAKALELAEQLRGCPVWMKVGLELFTASGSEIISKLKAMGYKVFLDLKFHDIPNTVYSAVRSAVNSGADMCNIHISGGERMGREAARAVQEAENKNCLLLGVTVLTSTSADELGGDVEAQVVNYAKKAQSWGLHGVVCSGWEAKAVKAACTDNFICLCPGIRPADAVADDQRRILTPQAAVKAGADFLVVGRPITKAPDPLKAAQAILLSMQEK